MGAAENWDLVNAVCGTKLNIHCALEERQTGSAQFMKEWDYDVLFVCDGVKEIEGIDTNMGHAVYAQDGIDFNDDIYCPFNSVEEVYAFDPFEAYGLWDRKELIKLFDDNYKLMCERFTDVVIIPGIYHTIMSGMIRIFGWDMLLTAAGTNPKAFGEVVDRYADWSSQYYKGISESIIPVIGSHDDQVWTEGAFINPEWYRRYIYPNLEMLWDPVRKNGKKIVFQSDGNYTEFIRDVAACGNHGFWFEYFTDLDAVCKNFGNTHVIFGNADTRILTFGTKEEIRREVQRCVDTGKNCPGYVMSVSGHFPSNMPVENALYFNEVFQELRYR